MQLFATLAALALLVLGAFRAGTLLGVVAAICFVPAQVTVTVLVWQLEAYRIGGAAGFSWTATDRYLRAQDFSPEASHLLLILASAWRIRNTLFLVGALLGLCVIGWYGLRAAS
jgi:hypothetical protein